MVPKLRSIVIRPKCSRVSKMTEPASTDPSVEDIVEQMLALAKRLQSAAIEHDTLTSLEELARVRRGAESSSGVVRALYEVAEGFVRAFVRGDFGRLGLEAARFVREHGQPARDLLRASVGAAGVRTDAVPEGLRAAVGKLVADGVLRETDGVLRVRPSARGSVGELIDPPLLRMWHAVEQARLSATGLPRAKQAAELARNLGIERAQAQDHLTAHPVTTTDARRMAQASQKVVLFATPLFQAGSQRKPDSSSLFPPTPLVRRDHTPPLAELTHRFHGQPSAELH